MNSVPGNKKDRKGFNAEERFVLSAQSLFFLKKKKNAEEFLKKAGLPERFKKSNEG